MFKKLREPAASSTITLIVDGAPVTAEPNETVAAVLLRLEPPYTRTTAVSGGRRAPYCLMGVCFDCLATVDGVRSTRTCQTLVRDGMCVERQLGKVDTDQ